MSEPTPSGEAEVLRIARREASVEHVREFEPITKGFWFAVAALIPLGAVAALGLVWNTLRRAIRR
jgi:hypothetical protein